MFHPFEPPRNLTTSQWRARVRAIQSGLQGLSIGELMRGGHGARAPAVSAHGQRRGGYDPNQPRVPAGHADGGQWSDDERWTSGRWLRERWARLRGGLQFAATERPPIDPRKFALFIARKLIEATYRELASWDLFGEHTSDQVTVAVTTIDGRDFHRTSSRRGDWRTVDHVEVRGLRSTILRRNPHLARRPSLTEVPLDAFYHAETNLLLRAAREHGGSLAGKSIDVFVDNEVCSSCKNVLRYVGLELGNPTVTFINSRTGRAMGVVRDGRWDPR
jgi:hypothetical protein